MSYYGHTSSGNLGLINTSFPILSGYPLCFGGWCYPLNLSTGGIFLQVAQGGSTNNNWCLAYAGTGGNWFGRRSNGSTADQLNSTITPASNWVYVWGRFISSTIFRWGIWDPNSGLQQFSSVSTITFGAAFDRAGIGLSSDTILSQGNVQGFIAHVWWTDADIYDSGSDLPTSMIFQLAKHGPLSYSHITPLLVDYLPLRSGMAGGLLSKRNGEFFSSKYGPATQAWTAQNLNEGTTTANGWDPPHIGRNIPGSQARLIHPPMYQLRRLLSSSALSIDFRKTLSGIGGRMGTRQTHGYMNG